MDSQPVFNLCDSAHFPANLHSFFRSRFVAEAFLRTGCRVLLHSLHLTIFQISKKVVIMFIWQDLVFIDSLG